MIFGIRKTLSFVIFATIAALYFHLLTNQKTDKTLDTCVIVLRESDGRLGNRMFIYAAALVLVIHHQCQMYVESSVLLTLQSTFHINPIRHISEDNFLLMQVSRQLYNGCKFYKSIIQPDSKEILELTGYWQNYRYFYHYWKEIRKQFTFKEKVMLGISEKLCKSDNSILRTISKTINQVYQAQEGFASAARRQQEVKHLLKVTNRTLIGVHIRRGDFLDKEHLGFVISSISYISRGFLFFSRKYPDSTFIIVSDDKKWCRINIADSVNKIVAPDTLTPSEDMALLTLCQHSLITTGTFGWWAATLTGGTVVCDKSYPKNGTWLSDLCPAEHYLPPWFKRL
jgi:galactoside 2-L-fucosyltransferase 1/2